MPKQSIWGIYSREGRLLDAVAVANTTPVVSRSQSMEALDGICFQLITTSTLAGAWKIEISNDSSSGLGNDREATGTWTDVTALFAPTIAAVTSGGSNQYTQAYLVARVIRVTFTASSGSGAISVYGFGKGNN